MTRTMYAPLAGNMASPTEEPRSNFQECVTHFVPLEPISEQSTVTVLVASSLCCCMLVLGALAFMLGYVFLMLWGIWILEDNRWALAG